MAQVVGYFQHFHPLPETIPPRGIVVLAAVAVAVALVQAVAVVAMRFIPRLQLDWHQVMPERRQATLDRRRLHQDRRVSRTKIE